MPDSWVSRQIKKVYYYSFKIFLLFWLAKITCTIHHNQLLLTKFGRVLPYWTNDVKSTAKLQIIEPLTKKTCFGSEKKSGGTVGGTFYLFHGEPLSKNIERRHLNEQHLLFGVNLQTWKALYLLNLLISMHYWVEPNIDRGKHVLPCF